MFSEADNISNFWFSLSEGASFIEYDSINFTGYFKWLTTFDKDSILSSFSRSHHDGRRCSKSKRTRTSNDDDRSKVEK